MRDLHRMFEREYEVRVNNNTDAPRIKIKIYGRQHVEHSFGSLDASLQVEGYWSGDTIRVNCLSGSMDQPKVNYGSGGYEDYDPVQRARNFAFAIAHAADLAGEWRRLGWPAAFDREFEIADRTVDPTQE